MFIFVNIQCTNTFALEKLFFCNIYMLKIYFGPKKKFEELEASKITCVTLAMYNN